MKHNSFAIAKKKVDIENSLKLLIIVMKHFRYSGTTQMEYTFHPTRKWRADLAFVDAKVLLEVEGGAFTQGRHTRGKGFIEDMEKYNYATASGFKIIRVTPDDLAMREPRFFWSLMVALMPEREDLKKFLIEHTSLKRGGKKERRAHASL